MYAASGALHGLIYKICAAIHELKLAKVTQVTFCLAIFHVEWESGQTTEQIDVAVTVWSCIQEVLGSNPDLDTSCPD
jgi:hypothetical protein